MRSFLILLILTAAAAADEAPSDEVQLAFGPLEALRPTSGPTGGLFAYVGGVAGTDGDHPTIAVAGRVTTGGPADDCSWFEGRGSMFLDGMQPVGETWASVCLFRAGKPDVIAPGFTVSGHVMFDVLPALDARRELITGRRTGESIDVDGSVLESVDAVTQQTIQIMPYRVDVDLLAEKRWSLDVGTLELSGNEITFGKRGEPTLLIIPASRFALFALFASNAGTAIVGGLQIFALDGLRLGRRFSLDVELDLAAAQVQGEDVVWSAKGALGVKAGPIGIRYARDVYPAFDDTFAIEDRWSGSVNVAGIDVGAYAAHTAVESLGGASVGWTGGGSLSRAVSIGRHFSMRLAGELGRSWYASLDPSVRPGLVARASLSFGARVGHP